MTRLRSIAAISFAVIAATFSFFSEGFLAIADFIGGEP